MPKFTVLKSVLIDAPKNQIYPFIADFKEWKIWSPWLCMEPEAKVIIEPDGKSYSWEGDLVGSGNMTILKEQKNNWISFDLHFLKPFKSHATTSFHLEDQGDKTKLTWKMNSSLPWFLFWMKKQMICYIGMDYDRGLQMIKSKVETGTIPSKLTFIGNQTSEAFNYIGLEGKCSTEAVGVEMEKIFAKLEDYSKAHPENITGPAFSIYHNTDIVKNEFHFTSGFQVKDTSIGNVGFKTGTVPKTPVYSLKHTGQYDFLGNAWATLYSMKQGKHIKVNSKIDPFEVYLNDPQTVSNKAELETLVQFPLKK